MTSSIYFENVLEDDCLLVALLNIRNYLLKEKGIEHVQVDQYSEQYKTLGKLGSLDQKQKLYDEIGLEISKEFDGLFDARFMIIENVNSQDLAQISERVVTLPLLLQVFSKYYGYHYIALIDYEPKTECWKALNFKMETNTKGWIFEEDLYLFSRHCGDVISFRLKKP